MTLRTIDTMKLLSLTLLSSLVASCATHATHEVMQGDRPSMRRDVREADAAPARPVRKPARLESAGELERAIAYYDGATRRTLYVSSEAVAEFAPSDASRDALLGARSGYAELEHAQPAVRVWRVGELQDADAFARGLTQDGARFSPVLHEGPSSRMPMLALPGGVIATFDAAWSRAAVDAWLAGQGLAAERELVAGSGMFLVPTEPGLESVDVANRLHETGELISCTPNWWRQATLR